MSGTLTKSQQTKLDGVVASLVTSLKIKNDAAKVNLGRYASKYARYKLSDRATGPHSHGFDAKQRQAIMQAIKDAFNIKDAPRKVAAPKASANNSQPKPKAKPKAKASTRKSTAKLAAEQTARAQG